MNDMRTLMDRGSDKILVDYSRSENDRYELRYEKCELSLDGGDRVVELVFFSSTYVKPRTIVRRGASPDGSDEAGDPVEAVSIDIEEVAGSVESIFGVTLDDLRSRIRVFNAMVDN